ncbi:MAG TPA: riboflavin synthase [Gemmataceae bacterium]|nr:riboflavin synthase [Gemmataceae bacterium]
MFTGLIEALGTIREIRPEGAGCRLVVAESSLAPELHVGDSVAVNGVCLTVVEVGAQFFAFQVGPESLQRTNLGDLSVGDRVNLERPLRMNDRLGGHIVQGHVDGVGRIAERQRQGDWELVWLTAPLELTAQMVPKGSIAVDGISLTLVDVRMDRFSVALIPHTLQHTTLGFKPVGASVNLETDLLGKYVWKALQAFTI